MKNVIYMPKQIVSYDVCYSSSFENPLEEGILSVPDFKNFEEALGCAKGILYILNNIYYVFIVKNVVESGNDIVALKSSEVVWEAIATENTEETINKDSANFS